MGVPHGLSDSGRDELASTTQLALGAGIDESTSAAFRYADFRISAGNSSTLPRSAGGIHFTGL